MKRKASKGKLEEDVLLCPLMPGESPPKLTNDRSSAHYVDSVGSNAANNTRQQLQGREAIL